MFETNNTQDILDSRDIIDRIEELKNEFSENTATDENPDGDNPEDYTMSEDDWAFGLGEDGASEMVTLLAFAAQGGTIEDWDYGVTLVRDSYFTAYARDLAEELDGDTDRHTWPHCHIDWEAAAESLQMDYTDVDYNGVTYWCR